MIRFSAPKTIPQQAGNRKGVDPANALMVIFRSQPLLAYAAYVAIVRFQLAGVSASSVPDPETQYCEVFQRY